MKRAAVIGGAIAIISVAAFGIVQAGWWAVVPGNRSRAKADIRLEQGLRRDDTS